MPLLKICKPLRLYYILLIILAYTSSLSYASSSLFNGINNIIDYIYSPFGTNTDHTSNNQNNTSISYSNYWDNIKQNFSWHEQDYYNSNNQLINNYLQYLKQHPTYMSDVSKRAKPYIYYISKQIETRKLPAELVLIPLVESHFDPFAFSHAGAAGIWQMTPITARHLNLDLNWWYDGRRDINASTNAALDYLEELYNYYDQDWLLAIAAYNSGRRIINKAIRTNKLHNKSTDFWSLDLPKETKRYVPKVIAFSKVILNPNKYNQELEYIPNNTYLSNIKLDKQINLALAAKLSNLDLKEIYLLNPGYNRFATAPNGPFNLLLPTKNLSSFEQNLKKYYKNNTSSDLVQYYRYKIKSGDNLITIAKKYNTIPSVIKQLNNLDTNMIKINNYLIIPSNQFNYDGSANILTADVNSKRKTHTVKPGDNLWDIAKKYDTTVNNIIEINNISSNKYLKPNQKLLVTKKSTNNKPARIQERKIYYKTKNGDSLASIANKYKLSIDNIVELNKNINKNTRLKPGQKLALKINVFDQYG